MQQLAEIRNDVKYLKIDVAQLNEKLDFSRAGKPRANASYEQVKLNNDITLGGENAKLAIINFTDY